MKLLFSNCLGDCSYSFQGFSKLNSITVTVSLFLFSRMQLQERIRLRNSHEYPAITVTWFNVSNLNVMLSKRMISSFPRIHDSCKRSMNFCPKSLGLTRNIWISAPPNLHVLPGNPWTSGRDSSVLLGNPWISPQDSGVGRFRKILPPSLLGPFTFPQSLRTQIVGSLRWVVFYHLGVLRRKESSGSNSCLHIVLSLRVVWPCVRRFWTGRELIASSVLVTENKHTHTHPFWAPYRLILRCYRSNNAVSLDTFSASPGLPWQGLIPLHWYLFSCGHICVIPHSAT